MANSIKPKAGTDSVQTVKPQSSYRSYDPRRWGQWLVQLVTKIKVRTMGRSAFIGRESDTQGHPFKHITNPGVAMRVLEKQRTGDRTPVTTNKMTHFQSLGKGEFGKTETVFPGQAGPISVRKQALKGTGAELRDEEKLLNKLDHPNIVKAARPSGLGLFQFGTGSHLHMEYGGTTLNKLKPHMTLTLAKKTMGQLVDALAYLKQQKVIHLDVTPDNILVNPNSQKLLLADFGVAEQTADGTRSSIRCQPIYSAPEVQRFFLDPDNSPNITSAADMFSAGCVLFEILTGCRYLSAATKGAPAKTELIKQSHAQHDSKFFMDKIIAGKVLDEEPQKMKAAISVLKAMLHPDPGQRITPEKLSEHPFFAGYSQPVTETPVSGGVLQRIKDFFHL